MNPQPSLIACPECGGSHFREVQYRQYVGGSSSATPGGELMHLTQAVTALVCICGSPLQRKLGFSTPREDRTSFQESLQKACKRREITDPESIRARLAEGFVTRQEFRNLTKNQRRLQDAVACLFKEHHEKDGSRG